MKLSVITINLNNAAGFKKTAESIVSQTCQDFEWIVIDGGSTDGSKELIKQYSDHIAYWVSEKDSGIYSAMNKGVKHANGEYIQFLNSGDWLCDDSVVASFIGNDNNAGIIYGDIVIKNSDITIENRTYADVMQLDYLLRNSIGHPSSFIKRMLLVNDPYNERYRIISDKVFFVRQFLRGEIFCHFSRFVCCFDINGVSTKQIAIVHKEEISMIKSLLPSLVYSGCSVDLISQLLYSHGCMHFRHVLPIYVCALKVRNSFRDFHTLQKS